MKREIALLMICRIMLRILVFGIVGAVVLGPLFTLLAMTLPMSRGFYNSMPRIYVPVAPALALLGAVFLGLVGFLTWKRQDYRETILLALGGFLSGAAAGGFCASLTSIMLNASVKINLEPPFIYTGILFGATLGAFCLALHPKYAPEEEPIVVLGDDYLKDEKIEWK